ncbi:hypothetical protein [Natrialba aegyptia]|uniref:hypothetical protein n=1 Tax=Natrialba aegyptia TaxID=129789 RepID=UPI001F4D0A17|nr:hypothetical protein [Natrialba aegyptia]
MSQDDITQTSRRALLRKSSVATVAGLGAVSATSASASATSFGLSELKAEGVVLESRDVSVPTDVRSGKRLLRRLAADGLLEEASLDVLPNQQFDENGQIHRTYTDGNKQIAFTTSTTRGRLQVSFGEEAIPSAALFPKDGGAVVLYTAPDGEEYRRFESDLTVSESDSEASADSCSGDNCDGCACEEDWCFVGRYKKKCNTCDDGECIITDSCGC